MPICALPPDVAPRSAALPRVRPRGAPLMIHLTASRPISLGVCDDCGGLKETQLRSLRPRGAGVWAESLAPTRQPGRIHCLDMNKCISARLAASYLRMHPSLSHLEFSSLLQRPQRLLCHSLTLLHSDRLKIILSNHIPLKLQF